jgi:sugar lactone lactonase YvrE
MRFAVTKHPTFGCCILLLLLISACRKDKNSPVTAPANLLYLPDNKVVLNGVSDTSVTPSIDWNNQQGTFSFAGPVPQGVTIDNHSGKISWTASLPIGTYLLPVVASNSAATADTTMYTLTVSGKIITVAGGKQGFAGDGGDALNAQLNMPFDVTTDAQGNVYICDGGNNRIRKITPDGVINTIAGDGKATYGGDGGPASQAQVCGPTGVITDGQDNLYITDFGNNRIRKIDASGVITTVAGSSNRPANLGDEGPATQASLYLLGGKVTFDAQGSLYIPDYGNQLVRKATPDGIIHSITGKSESVKDGINAANAYVSGPCGVYWDAVTGNLYIASNLASAIYRINAGLLYGVAGNINLWGAEGHTGDGGPAVKATLFRPTNIVADKDGNLFIADFQNNKIRRVDTNGIISTIAGNGTQGTAGDGGPAAAAQLSLPYGLALDARGDLYIADTYNNRIRKVILH